MKVLLISCASLLVLFSCKKREEISVKPLPDISHNKIIEITDTIINQGDKHEAKTNYFYNEIGLMTKIEMENQNSTGNVPYYNSRVIKNFQYSNGWLNGIEENSSSTFGTQNNYQTISRNEKNQIINIKYSTDQNVDLKYIDKKLSSQINNFISIKDTQTYSSYSGERWVIKESKQFLHFNEGNDRKFEKKENRSFDKEERLIKMILNIKDYSKKLLEDGTQGYIIATESKFENLYSNFDSPALSSFRDDRRKSILAHYTPNVDAGEELNILPPDLDALTSNSDYISSENISYTSTVSDFNSHGLPRKVVIKAVEKPSYTRTIHIKYDSE